MDIVCGNPSLIDVGGEFKILQKNKNLQKFGG